MGGAGGNGGEGGEQGEAGMAGRGGRAGLAQPRVQFNQKQGSIPQGANAGIAGSAGRQGRKGSRGNNGSKGGNGREGEVEYILFNRETGGIIESSNKLYEGKITSFQYIPVLDDGIIEPKEEIIITDITFHNVGGLSFPAGLQFFIIPLENLEFSSENTVTYDKAIPPNTSLTLPIQLKCNIGKQVGCARFLIGFKFNSKFKHISIGDSDQFTISHIKYPVFIHPIQRMNLLTRGDNQILLKLENLSKLAYGSATESLQALQYRISSSTSSSSSTKDVLINGVPIFTSNIEDIPAASTLSFHQCISINLKAKFYQINTITIQLYFRNELTQSFSFQIKNIPQFNMHQKENDVLLLISSQISEDLFGKLDSIFTMLNLSVNIFDYNFYHSYHAFPSFSWIKLFQNKLILFFVDDEAQLKQFPLDFLRTHFYNEENQANSFSSLLLYGNVTQKQFYEYLFSSGSMYSENPLVENELSDWFTVLNVNQSHMSLKIQTLEKSYQSLSPFLIKKIINQRYRPMQVDTKNFVQQLWCYGSASVAESFFSTCCNIRLVSSQSPSLHSLLQILFECFPIHLQFQCLRNNSFIEHWSAASNVAFVEYLGSFLFQQFSRHAEDKDVLASNLSLLSSFFQRQFSSLVSLTLDDSVMLSQFLILCYRLNYLFAKKSMFAIFTATIPISASNQNILNMLITNAEKILGKNGSNLQKIAERTSTSIKVSTKHFVDY